MRRGLANVLAAGLLAVLVVGCSRFAVHGELRSGIDSQYRWGKVRREARFTESPGVRFYQNVLRQTLASHCDFFPSDSVYVQTTFRRCGPVRGILKGMARFFAEPDAANTGYAIVKQGNQILFEDIPHDCSW